MDGFTMSHIAVQAGDLMYLCWCYYHNHVAKHDEVKKQECVMKEPVLRLNFEGSGGAGTM